MLTELEVAGRLPVWHALADLFLDTELEPADDRRIAATLRASGLPPGALRTILEEEVAPAFAFNLLAVAGEWAGWSEEEVRAIMLRSLRSGRRLPPLNWLKKRLARRHAAEAWARIAPLLEDVGTGA